MKIVGLVVLLLSLAGCQLLQQPPPPEPELPPVTEPPPQQTVPEPLPDTPALQISDKASALQAWVDYRANVLHRLAEERELLLVPQEPAEVWALKRTILQLHPDTPYLSRLRVQMQLAEQLQQLPPSLAALLSWDVAFNQKLLEAESAVSALTRLNAQQHDNIERLQKTNKELQKKIDALTQIEAQLNQQVKEDNNGQP